MNYKKHSFVLWMMRILPLAIIFFISFIANKFPSGATVAGGDFYQLIDPLKHFGQYFYAWINQAGQGQMNSIFPAAPFYLALGLLDWLGFSSENISSFYIFVFLYGSYLSFYISIKWLYPGISGLFRVGGGLTYALNYFTFSIFTYSWGFSHHLLFYIFIPLLVSLFIKILFEKSFVLRDFVLYALVFLCSTIAYANTAFLLALFFIQFLLVVVFLMEGRINGKNIWKKVLLFAFIYIFIFGYFIFSFFISNYQYQSSLSHSVVLGGNSVRFIMGTSNDVMSILSLDMNKKGLSLNIFYPIALIWILIIFLRRKRMEMNARQLIFGMLTVFLILIFLAVRIRDPFFGINSFLYGTQFFSFFRSPEKIFVFLPFLWLTILIGMTLYLKIKRNVVLLIFAFFLCVPYGFYFGGIIDGLRRADKFHPYIVKIPDEYRQSANIVNKDKKSASIISLPYSVTNSINWSDYPKWGFIGQDILYLLYDKYFISANVFDHSSLETSLSFKKYNKNGAVNKGLFLKLAQKFSGQFIIFHKDINPDWLAGSKITQLTLENLQEEGVVDNISDNDYFTLYQLKDAYVKPVISSNDANVQFEKINPSKYKVSIKGINKKSLIEFHQAFNSQWVAIAESSSNVLECKTSLDYQWNNVTECNNNKFFEGDEFSLLFRKYIPENFHKVVDKYANGWIIDPDYIKNNFEKSDYKENPDGSIDVNLVLYFKPQSYFYLGIIISGMTLLACLGYLGYDWRKRQKDLLDSSQVDE